MDDLFEETATRASRTRSERSRRTPSATATAAAGGGLRIERRVCEGDSAGELINQSGDLDLLVIGSRGFGPLRRIVPGSTGAKVLRAAECPVLVLPRATPEELDDAGAELAGAGAKPAAPQA